MARRRSPPTQGQLLDKSREAALNAVQTFNNPLTTFKTETFIVLMVIAWTYLLHAHYRRQGVEYRYFKIPAGSKRRKFCRTKSGAFKYWELQHCLNEKACPLDGPTKSHLRFLIGLRNEIEHHQSTGVDEAFTGRYIACLLNYERTITQLFGSRYTMAENMLHALQFRDLTSPPTSDEDIKPLPSSVAKYTGQFDSKLPFEEHQHPHFSFRVIFIRKLTNNIAQADRAFEFIGSDTDLAKNIDKQYWVQKEVERPKHRPGRIVELMKQEGYSNFNMYHHTGLWKKLDAKNPGRGYGVEVEGVWYWYDRWLDVVREHCKDNAHRYVVSSNQATP